MDLSVIVPVYNERQTLATLVASVCHTLPEVQKEIIIVDDCSTDGSREWLKANFPDGPRTGYVIGVDAAGGLIFDHAPNEANTTIVPIYHERNRGKGGSVRTALSVVSGDVIVIQDADLEYDPQELTPMYDLIAVRKVADVVYGSRFYGRPHRSLYFHHYVANRFLSLLFSLFYNQTLTDIEVCYKMFRRDVMKDLNITCDDFGMEIQISSQIARQRSWRIYEIGISYFGRTYAEGKKINWKDGLLAVWYLIKFRFAN